MIEVVGVTISECDSGWKKKSRRSPVDMTQLPVKVPKPRVNVTCQDEKIYITCEVEDIKDLSFSWSKNGKDIKEKEKVLIVKADKSKYACIAKNPVHNNASDQVKAACNMSQDTLFGFDFTLMVSILAGGGGLVLVLIIVLVSLACRSCKRREKHQQDEEEFRLNYINTNHHPQKGKQTARGQPAPPEPVDYGSAEDLSQAPELNRSRPGLTTTAIGAVDLQGAGGNWATVGRRSRGGRRVRRQREKRKGKSVGLRIGTLNVGTMTGKGRELADVMERRKVDILCVQETRWKGSKARSIGAGFKLFYYGVDSKRNGVGVVLKEEFVRNVLEVKRVSDRVMSLKLEIEGVMLNVVSGYAPQVGCELEEKERFWSELDEVMESIPTGERVVIGADFNGHVGEGNTGDEEVMGKFGVKERNLEGQMVVDFAKRMDMGVVNTYLQKREEHRVTYKNGGRSTQKKRSEIEKKTKWWKLKKEECCEEFRQKLRQALGGQVVLPDDWETTAEVIRETGRKVLGVSSGRRKEDKETWWWNEEVQDSIQGKRLAKKKWDMDRTEENRQEYKELQRRVKREVSKAKQKAYDELYTRLDTREGEKDLYRLARQRDRDGKDVQQKVDKIRKDEVRKALKRMKSGKAVGPDDIPVEVWKCLGEAAVEFLASLFNRVLENLEKAYDRVPREELWYCMRKSGVAEKYVRVVQDMYERSRTVVRCAVVMDQLSEEVRQESPWTMMFADDIVICSESREEVEVCAGEKRNEDICLTILVRTLYDCYLRSAAFNYSQLYASMLINVMIFYSKQLLNPLLLILMR
ncbi:hypothetical protein QTP86_012712 [Hemibagrus guttatus]|nr:hypothetical protein QTP86_012712 [Hemibagrus guttatus]